MPAPCHVHRRQAKTSDLPTKEDPFSRVYRATEDMEKRERAEFSRKLAPRCAGDLQGRKGEQDEKAEYAPRQESVLTVFGLISLGDRSVSAIPAMGGLNTERPDADRAAYSALGSPFAYFATFARDLCLPSRI